MWKPKKTFEELVNEIGLDTVFFGTNADQTIKEIFLEWLFDYRLCSDDDATFLRYFRRRFNNLYPRYLEQVRILSTRANFDPFVTEYFQDLINKEETETSSNSKTAEGENTVNVTATKGSGSTTVRTPDLTNETVESNTVTNEGSVTNSGTDSTAHTGTESTDRDGTTTTTKTGTDTTVLDEDVVNDTTAKSDAFGIAYPESNLGSIPATIDFAHRTIDYANSESLSMNDSHATTANDATTTVTHNTEDETVVDETDTTTHNTTDATTYGLKTDTENETTGSGTSTTTETGTERTVVTNSGSDTTATVTGNEVSESNEGERNAQGTIQQEHKGRNESVADIIPRAIKAIVNTNEVMWFIDAMKVCFDCTSFDY